MIIDKEKIACIAKEKHRAELASYYPEQTAAEIEELVASRTADAAVFYEAAYNEALDKKIAEILEKYPKAHILRVEDKIAFLKPMSRELLSMATTLAGDDKVKITEMLLDNCWIEGDEEIRQDDDYFIPSIAVLQDLLRIKTATLVKL